MKPGNLPKWWPIPLIRSPSSFFLLLFWPPRGRDIQSSGASHSHDAGSLTHCADCWPGIELVSPCCRDATNPNAPQWKLRGPSLLRKPIPWPNDCKVRRRFCFPVPSLYWFIWNSCEEFQQLVPKAWEPNWFTFETSDELKCYDLQTICQKSEIPVIK